MPTCTDICSFINKRLTAKAVVELCLLGMCSCIGAAIVSWDLGFDVKSCNWCEAVLPVRINFIKYQHYCFYFHRFISLYNN